ncbi:energy-coupling factor transporter transmembrane component T family protein [Geoalkalibacter sp.]|uniref:energy-coupling factor transporter transmembrane component T family protein n=1 Tax=Geoalkalibacter sp. TaxID=3041440 RepID=UPI00272EC091|nr:energy-coupling factor transporter transmembrane protein EcfT [Geoalkalibacter sp.]
MLDDLILGRFVPGQSLLHRFDARLKLILLLSLIVTALASSHFGTLVALSALTLLLASACGVPGRRWWRGLWMFRWLFLFTLLLHLLFSPGRTLLDMAFLSYDGLQHGLRVIWQLALAVLLSSVLTLTSSPAALARGLTALAAPLQRVRIPVARAGDFLLLILYFLPLLREELARARPLGGPHPQGLPARLRQLRDSLAPLLMRLADRAEDLAQAMARGDRWGEDPREPAVVPLSGRQNWGIFFAGLLLPVILLGLRLWPTSV